MTMRLDHFFTHSVFTLVYAFLSVLCVGWYLFFYAPLGITICALDTQTAQLQKKISSLQKRSVGSLLGDEHHELLKNALKKRIDEFPLSCTQAASKFLDHIQTCNLQLTRWKPGVSTQYDHFSSCDFEWGMKGTFNQLSDFFEHLPGGVKECSWAITKETQMLTASGTFLLFFKDSL